MQYSCGFQGSRGWKTAWLLGLTNSSLRCKIVSSKEHNKEIANNIIKKIQSLFDTKKYITVKFN